MIIKSQDISNYLQTFDFKRMFIEELGWSAFKDREMVIDFRNSELLVTPISEAGGFPVFLCTALNSDIIPNYNVRRKVEREVSLNYREHLIIYIDKQKTQQIWQWVKKVKGEPLSVREHKYTKGQSGESLIQKLRSFHFTFHDFDQEGNIGINRVTERVRQAFDVDRVTKKFYDNFKKERENFAGYISGINDQETKEWYVSVVLNRLMFVYFIQKKGFLDDNINYLKDKLNEVTKIEKNIFFKDFIQILFFEGFAKEQKYRTLENKNLLGEIPYLNGGLFLKHEIEEEFPEINISDEGFLNVFNFFEQYNWHLDDRETKQDNEINPDVIGHLFEKYINQKQMGAYYTKEDITDYIGTNSIIPYMLERLKEKHPMYFVNEHSIAFKLSSTPERYIYESNFKGYSEQTFDKVKRNREINGNQLVDEELALPKENYNEVVERLSYYENKKSLIREGEIKEINDLVTYNFNIRQFMQDFIEEIDDAKVLGDFYKIIKELSVLDPTCGSGAFLFEALNILLPIYESCLERMELFVQENNSESLSEEIKAEFQEIISKVTRHPNRKYFILKTIMVNNLYGVDIMEEATEICKLRLFLKLISQVGNAKDIEPLPDIDFNIRAGNTLIGFESFENLERIINKTLDLDNSMETIRRQAADVEKLFSKYKNLQTAIYSENNNAEEIKLNLKLKLKDLEKELNLYLMDEYDIPDGNRDNWLKSNLPFHWFVEFYGIMKNGGFNIIIGNPPYVEYRKVKKEYQIKNFKTEGAGNLYAFVIERCNNLLSKNGRIGMIIPHSGFCTDRMSSFMDLYKEDKIMWISTYSIRPSKLFNGVDQRLAIFLYQSSPDVNETYSTKFHHWFDEYRPFLFENLRYIKQDEVIYKNSIPKISHEIEIDIWKKLNKKKKLENSLIGESKIYYHNGPRYWIRAMTFIPYFWNEKDGEKVSSHVKELSFTNAKDGTVAAAIFNSSLFFWWFILLSNCRDLSSREIKNFPMGIEKMDNTIKIKLVDLCEELMTDYKKNSIRKEAKYSTGKVIYDEYYPRYSKEIIDRIDDVLAEYYLFTNEEVQFIKNYEIKYRAGADED